MEVSRNPVSSKMYYVNNLKVEGSFDSSRQLNEGGGGEVSTQSRLEMRPHLLAFFSCLFEAFYNLTTLEKLTWVQKNGKEGGGRGGIKNLD